MRSESSAPSDRSFEVRDAHESSATWASGRVAVLDSDAPQAIEWTAERLAAGGVVAIPTDTVYGLAASLAHPTALDRIYEIKGRPTASPLPVLISSIESLSHLVRLDDAVVELLDAFWPGPLTVVLPASTALPARAMGPGGTIGVRLPSHPIAIEVIEQAGGSIACTSANRSGEAPGVTAREVAQSIGSRIDLILDSGPTPGGVASTVVVIDGASLRFLREGALPIGEVIRIWDDIYRGT